VGRGLVGHKFDDAAADLRGRDGSLRAAADR
jgi:hypothetical protein